MNARTCFDILRISRDASLDDAKESYKRLVKLWHPDQYGNFPEKQRIAEEKLKELNVAYRDVVTVLKSNPAVTTIPPSGKETQQSTDGSHPTEEKAGMTFWNQIALFINNKIFKSDRFENTEKNTHLSPSGIQPERAVYTGETGRTAPEFHQILKKAIHNRGTNREVRKRPGNRNHMRRQYRSAPSYRSETVGRRNPGDRVEKISPVGRVKRIGGD